MAEIKSESVADFIPESPADFPRNMHINGRKRVPSNGGSPRNRRISPEAALRLAAALEQQAACTGAGATSSTR
jgi:hypothetical protein